jgi:hypothetical protein
MIAASSAVQIISQPQNIRVLNGDRVQLACTIDSNGYVFLYAFGLLLMFFSFYSTERTSRDVFNSMLAG